jgi:hypothetical protein
MPALQYILLICGVKKFNLLNTNASYTSRDKFRRLPYENVPWVHETFSIRRSGSGSAKTFTFNSSARGITRSSPWRNRDIDYFPSRVYSTYIPVDTIPDRFNPTSKMIDLQEFLLLQEAEAILYQRSRRYCWKILIIAVS